ncbi:MAG: ribosome biogenesis GTPase Der [Chloroflexi bacterium]|nr:ribosome biogenesis GTPase Der [Chloroflexota bacterium]
MPLPIITIVGRPNVGKSTLFNRLVGERIAIVSDIAGTTRDRVSSDARWHDERFILVDTAGIEAQDEIEPQSVSGLGATETLLSEVQAQTTTALEDADLLIFMVDASQGVTPKDIEAADAVRRSGKPVILAANKADNFQREMTVSEFYELGLGDPIAFSAYHDINMSGLMEAVLGPLDTGDEDTVDDSIRVAIAGRPNVGKSAMLNAITGETRAIVSSVAGTTRDSVDSKFMFEEREITLIDTAGLRRRGKAGIGIEKYSVLRTVRSIERSHVTLLLLDATEVITAQDTHVAGLMEDAARGAVIVVNKWDLADEEELEREKVERDVRARLQFLEGAPIVFTSALTRKGVNRMLRSTLQVYENWTREVDQGDLQRMLLDALAEHPIPTGGKDDVRMKSVIQTKSAPPSFVFKVNQPKKIHFSYKRYLENRIRKEFNFEGSPLRLHFRTKV